jgi:tetratricopeptide (TPR) repeat protein
VGPRFLVVVPPRFAYRWEAADALFFRFVVEGLRDAPSRVILISTGDGAPIIPSDWEVCWLESDEQAPLGHTEPPCLIPGVLDASQVADPANHLDGRQLWEFSPGFHLVVPECRRAPSEVAPQFFDRLAATARLPWLRAYGQLHGSNYYVEPDLLLAEGTRSVSEGGEERGFAALERASTCAVDPIGRAVIRLQLQGLRLAVQRYAEAAEEKDPDPGLPAALEGRMLQDKGWALLLRGEHTRGEAYLRAALDRLTPLAGESRELLYLKNIYALALLRTGDIEGATRLEQDIREECSRRGLTDARLYYINSINLARLYYRQQRYAAAATCYGVAFETNFGLRSESDLVYTNSCLGRLYSAAGKQELASRFWLRAAIHWVSSSAPEALAPRVVAMLLQGQQPTDEHMVVSVSAALLERLREVFPESGDFRSDSSFGIDDVRPGPNFLRIQNRSLQSILTSAVGSDGWGVILSATSHRLAVDCEAHRRLRLTIAVLLERFCPGCGVASAPSVLVDDQFGRELPATWSQLRDMCVRLGIKHLRFSGLENRLDKTNIAGFRSQCRVWLSMCVDRIAADAGGGHVFFKRCRGPRLLTPAEARLLRLVGEGISLSSLCEQFAGRTFDRAVWVLLRCLEEDRVCYVGTVPEKALFALNWGLVA